MQFLAAVPVQTVPVLSLGPVPALLHCGATLVKKPPFFETSAGATFESLIKSMPVAHEITRLDYIALWDIDWLMHQAYNVSAVVAPCKR